MKRILALVVFAGIAAAGARLAWSPGEADTIVTSSIATASLMPEGRGPGQPATREAARYLVSNPARNESCHMKRLGETASGERLSAGSQCDKVWPGLSGVVSVDETGKGSFAMRDSKGHTVLAMAVGDGAAYESVDANGAMVSVFPDD
ncbi:hypothetical protein [Pararhizobium mangrovi]|uniref:Alkaline proteinase inhibitor/ Outer membrane lipoprotein Omp19 domain-containing protein n=1 Tax=Pararhizobium mangrovi TaxID=2590452 RepID=A0A506UBC3_9HYPH|nr:hypothetical protein [Pararhizobium mangrovi]TPW30676.1 hypothetical protein FJU11_04430 [Pararhizobium mangrovi]